MDNVKFEIALSRHSQRHGSTSPSPIEQPPTGDMKLSNSSTTGPKPGAKKGEKNMAVDEIASTCSSGDESLPNVATAWLFRGKQAKKEPALMKSSLSDQSRQVQTFASVVGASNPTEEATQKDLGTRFEEWMKLDLDSSL